MKAKHGMKLARIILTLICLLLLGTELSAAKKNTPKRFIKKDADYLVELYKHLHSHPELSTMEKETSERIAVELEKAGLQVTRGIGGYGLVGVYKNGEGPTVLVRTDMDALPVKELTGLPYASQVTTTDKYDNEIGVMHACGHDVHMTAFIGTARVLMKFKDLWQGTIVMVGQPAEETISGARRMIEEGLFTRFPKPDYILGLHVFPMPNVLFAYREKHFYAGQSTLNITVRGVGGHGARPHKTRDPIVMAAQMIQAYQTIVSREIDPAQPAVVTVGSIHGGTASNIIPEEVEMKLTIRAFSDEVRHKMIESIKRITNSIAMANAVPENKMPVYTQDEECPAVYNDPELTSRMVKIMKKVYLSPYPMDRITSSDDFANYGTTKEKIPSLYFGIGAYKLSRFGKGAAAVPPLHNPKFAPDDPKVTIKAGVKALSAAVMELLKK